MELGGFGISYTIPDAKNEASRFRWGVQGKDDLSMTYAVMGRERFCMSVSVVTQVYEMTMLETNYSQKLSI